MNTTPNPLYQLLGSTKFVVLFLAIAVVTLLAALGRIPGESVLEFLKYAVPSWLLAQGVQAGMQNAGQHISDGLSGAQRPASVPPPQK